jgi:hypothetical protein
MLLQLHHWALRNWGFGIMIKVVAFCLGLT